MPNNNMPIVSIIIVTYNRLDMLREAIQSVFDQTVKEWELIVLDYNEDPNFTRKIREWTVKDDRVRWIWHDKNVNNIAYCWNEGLDLARGEFWSVLDDDNKKDPDFIEQMLRYLEQENPTADAAVCGMRHFGVAKGSPAHGVHMQRDGNYKDGEFRRRNPIDSGCLMFRKTLVDKIGYYDERMVTLDDWEYNIRLFETTAGKGFGYLNKVLCSHRWHDKKRVWNSTQLGLEKCTEFLQNKRIPAFFRLLFVEPDDTVTESQKQIKTGIKEALKQIPLLHLTDDHPDFVWVMGPLWHHSVEKLRELRNKYPQSVFVALCCEDPQGIMGNLSRIEFFNWIVTNDINAVNVYREKFRRDAIYPGFVQIYHWNCLSIDEATYRLCVQPVPQKKYDVAFIGYPYPSRIKFIRKLKALLPDIKLALVGDTWDKQKIDAAIFPTLSAVETAKIGRASKIVLCKHRTQADLGGFPVVVPGSVNRGYIEAAYRSLVMIDKDRQFSSFNGTEAIEWYDSVLDAAERIKWYLADYAKAQEKIESCYKLAMERFTYLARVKKIFNCLRSPRYNVIIP
ncbi:MAG: glycosyltransferase [Planctomycetota bacterium]|nr:glycosyltransferase [Planctomycetota bacterium]